MSWLALVHSISLDPHSPVRWARQLHFPGVRGWFGGGLGISPAVSAWVGTHHQICTIPENNCQQHFSGSLTTVPKVGGEVRMSLLTHGNPEVQGD